MKVNTVYFFSFFLAIMAMSLFHLGKAPLFFFLQAFGQASLEAGVFLWLALALNRWAPRWLFHSFIGFSFTTLLFHFGDFTSLRLTDTSLSFFFKYLLGSGVDHVITAFRAMNVNSGMLCIIFFSLVFIPIIGILFYRATRSIAPCQLSFRRLSTGLVAIGVGLLGLDLICHSFLSQEIYEKYQKALPLGTTFIHPTARFFSLDVPIAKAREEETVQEALRRKNFSSAARPNIYLFVIETLRKDYITPEVAPNLSTFASENISFPESFANSSSTPTSWFAIFHADFPHHWAALRDSWKQGSVPLQILKALGYRIRVYSAADLRHYGMDQLLFGEKLQLIDQLEESPSQEAWQRDVVAVETFLRDLERPDAAEGNVFLFFLDSTHSEYSIPADFFLRFQPMAKEVDYLTLSSSRLEPIKNRYRNAIAYIDSLIARCFSTLKERGLYDSAIIAVTGDHGEEFFEEGALFHGTHLNRYQLSVPLYYKFQTNPWAPLDTVSTHLDIFPSVLHYLTGESHFEELFDGQSLFAPGRWPFCISFLQNGREMPSEFLIQGKKSRYRLRLHDPMKVEILSANDSLPAGGDLFRPLLEKR